ncbi:hypothetical protein B4113_3426 [Geobacillus sp. B4113_201601]|nr:hypothetical protein B4113_3426 [Geobacillus sp. B4113_201601]
MSLIEKWVELSGILHEITSLFGFSLITKKGSSIFAKTMRLSRLI